MKYYLQCLGRKTLLGKLNPNNIIDVKINAKSFPFYMSLTEGIYWPLIS